MRPRATPVRRLDRARAHDEDRRQRPRRARWQDAAGLSVHSRRSATITFGSAIAADRVAIAIDTVAITRIARVTAASKRLLESGSCSLQCGAATWKHRCVCGEACRLLSVAQHRGSGQAVEGSGGRTPRSVAADRRCCKRGTGNANARLSSDDDPAIRPKRYSRPDAHYLHPFASRHAIRLPPRPLCSPSCSEFLSLPSGTPRTLARPGRTITSYRIIDPSATSNLEIRGAGLSPCPGQSVLAHAAIDPGRSELLE